MRKVMFVAFASTALCFGGCGDDDFRYASPGGSSGNAGSAGTGGDAGTGGGTGGVAGTGGGTGGVAGTGGGTGGVAGTGGGTGGVAGTGGGTGGVAGTGGGTGGVAGTGGGTGGVAGDAGTDAPDDSSAGSGGTAGAAGGGGTGGGQAGQGGAADAGPDALVCTAPMEDCDNNASNGCEINTNTDLGNCGGCGIPCAGGTHSTAACAGGTCTISCNSGYKSCDLNNPDACETYTSGDLANCGACNNPCPTPAHATPSCTTGNCGYACNGGYGDCNTVPGDGCEAVFATDRLNCGGCGTVCGDANTSSASCASGTCQIVCLPGFENCDGQAANGCEVNTLTNATNCGACGHSCLGSSCSGGLCTPVSLGQGDTIPDTAVDNGKICWTTQYFDPVTAYSVTCTPNGFGWTPTVAPWAIDVDGADVYWVEGSNLRMKSGSGPVTTFYTLAGMGDIAVDTDRIYMLVGGTSIRWVSRQNSGQNGELATGVSGTNLIAGPQAVYWIGSSCVGRVDKGGSATLTLECGNNPRHLTQNTTHVFWYSSTGQEILRYPQAGGLVDVLTAWPGVWGLTADDTYIYVNEGGKLWKQPIGGGARTVVVESAGSSACALQVDASRLYWCKQQSDYFELYSVAK